MLGRTCWIVWVAGCLLGWVGAGTSLRSALHPMDGPDAELRLLHTQAGLRLSVRVNLAWLDEVLAEPRENPNVVAPTERIELEGAAWDWIQAQELLRSDSAALVGRLESAEWVEADPERAMYFPRTGVRALTYLELKVVYPFEANTDAVILGWPAYPIDPVLAGPSGSPTVQVQATLLSGAEERIVNLSEESPNYRWRLPQSGGADHLLPLPPGPASIPGPKPRTVYLIAFVAAVVAVGGLYRHRLRLLFALGGIAGILVTYQRQVQTVPPIGVPEGEAVFAALQQNLYRAFDFHEREAIYDALEKTVAGDLLPVLYEEIHASLVLEEEGGALCRVEKVTPLDAHITPKPTLLAARLEPFGVDATWRVEGVLHHWGHSHRQAQQMKAHFEVAYTEAGWRFLSAQIRESVRIPPPEEAPAAVEAVY
ncbi:MAG: hypothetical protein H6830_10420 [Planctomycetes bacterium]|nr:hypothetical protein [Planctomycetota bacterium]MCB9909527.1 hypothetical protein [Planctomycetota bacterium]MCB9912506.1 hypothetical protein [Planctomycetota bacterium]HPF15021.1 hypothetical protein [Planctomycetota bacterium]